MNFLENREKKYWTNLYLSNISLQGKFLPVERGKFFERFNK